MADVASNIYILTFLNLEKVKEILDTAPWNIMGNLFNVLVWNQVVRIHEVCFSRIPFCVQVHNVFLEFSDEDNARGKLWM